MQLVFKTKGFKESMIFSQTPTIQVGGIIRILDMVEVSKIKVISFSSQDLSFKGYLFRMQVLEAIMLRR